MAGSLRVQLNTRGIRNLLQSQEVVDDLERRAKAIAQAAGGEPDFEARVQRQGGSSKLGRAMGYVTTASVDGMRASAQDNVLIRAVDAGRG